MGIPAFSGCTKGSYCSDQMATKVGDNQTQIYHRSVTTLTGTGPAYSGSKTETYIISKNAAGVDTWVLAATSTDGGKTQTFTSAAGEDLKKSMAPGGNMYKNTQKQVQDTLSKGGASQGVISLPGTSGSLEKISPEQQKKLGIVPEGQATESGDVPPLSTEQLTQLISANAETRKSFPKNLKYPADLQNTVQDVIKFNMVEYSPKSFSTGSTFGFSERRAITDTNIIGSVILPIQGGINDTNSVTWGEDRMTAGQAILANLALSGILGGGKEMANQAGEDLDTIRKNLPEAQAAVAGFFTEQATGVPGILARTTGGILNQNLELLFQGPSLRPFTFTFRLSARGKADTDQIRQIIRFFKQGMAAQRSQSNLFLKSPHTFKIQYLHKDKDHPYINRIKECALQSFTVDYTPDQQYMTFADGAMTSYQIQMQFSELEPIYNDDYSKLPGGNSDTEIGY